MCMHYAIRALIHTAARHGDLDPDRISFTRALHATGRSVRTGIHSALTLTQALARATTELLRGLLQPRRPRANPRAVRRKISSYGVKRAAHQHWPQPIQPIGTAAASSARLDLSP